MKKVTSPNFNERAPGISLNYIVLHYTGMKDKESALKRLCDPEAKVSAHYMIDEEGKVIQLVDEDKRAWHAGKSFWRGITDVNSASIGIELVNPGHEFGYRRFPEAQIIKLKSLLRDLITRHAMSAKHALLAHSDIAPSRKQDPGEFFPWQYFAQEGLGIWPKPETKDMVSTGPAQASSLLAQIGYDPSNLQDALLAFQRRYSPEHMSGSADKETTTLLRAIKRQMDL